MTDKKDEQSKFLKGKFLFQKPLPSSQRQDDKANLGLEAKEKMGTEDINEKLLKAAESGNPHRFLDLIEQGADVNYRDPSNGATALHIAAANSAILVIDKLLQHKDINFLVQDKMGRLPSALAIEVAQDSEISELLMEREIHQAKELGVDYRSYLVGSNELGLDP